MALFFDPKQECFRGSNENVRNKQFDMYLKKINKVTYSDKTDIEKVRLIVGHAKKLRLLYQFHDLEKCDEDELTYLLNVYSEILSVLKDYKSDSSEYRTHYKEVEDVYKNIRDARKEITVKTITKAVERSRSQSVSHIPSDMPPPIPRQREDHELHFVKPPPAKSSNPFAKGNEDKHKKYVQEQKEKKQKSASSPDLPPPPPPPYIVTPPKSSRSRSRSRSRSARSSEGKPAIVTPPKGQRSRSRSSPNKLLESRSLGRSLGMTARRVPSLSKRRRGGETRKNKKTRKIERLFIPKT